MYTRLTQQVFSRQIDTRGGNYDRQATRTDWSSRGKGSDADGEQHSKHYLTLQKQLFALDNQLRVVLALPRVFTHFLSDIAVHFGSGVLIDGRNHIDCILLSGCNKNYMSSWKIPRPHSSCLFVNNVLC